MTDLEFAKRQLRRHLGPVHLTWLDEAVASPGLPRIAAVSATFALRFVAFWFAAVMLASAVGWGTCQVFGTLCDPHFGTMMAITVLLGAVAAGLSIQLSLQAPTLSLDELRDPLGGLGDAEIADLYCSTFSIIEDSPEVWLAMDRLRRSQR